MLQFNMAETEGGKLNAGEIVENQDEPKRLETVESGVELEAEPKIEFETEAIPEVTSDAETEPWRTDKRLLYIRSMVEKSLSIKPEQWIKMIEKSENRDGIFEFLNKTEKTKIFFMKIGSAIVSSVDGFPAEFTKGKFIYFLRRSNHEQITEANCRQSMLVGSCSDNPMRDFSIYVDNVVVPLLMNPKNTANWPKVLKKELRKKLQDLRNSITETLGAINDRTVLPLPVTLTALMKISSNIMNDDFSEFTAAMRESIEQIVLRWSRSVNAYINRSSFTIFNQRKYATIDDEVDFWRARLENLKNIYDQLRSREIKTIALILEKCQSVYVNEMKRILSKVASAYEQARDIDLYLKPLQHQLDKFQSIEFCDAHHLVTPLLHTIVLIWSKSKHLSSNERIVHLFKLMHHKLFEFVADCLNPQSIFAGDIADTLEKIEKTLTNLTFYKETYAKYRSTLDQYRSSSETAELWSFDPDEIFANFDQFFQRIVKTNEMLQLLHELKKMEDTIFGGHSGKRVTHAVQKISDSVSILTDSLKNIQFNVLNLDETDKFTRLTTKFENEVTDLQQKLAKQYAMSFDECNTISKCIKLIVNLGNTLHLPIVYQELSPKFEKIARMLVTEVRDVERIFESQVTIFQSKPFDEVLIWLSKLKSRLTEQTKYMESQKIKLFDSDYGHYAIIQYTKLIETLENWEKQFVQQQIDRFVRDAEVIMANFLLVRNDDGSLAINLRPEFNGVLKGISRIKMNSIPLENEKLEQLWARRDELWTLKMKLLRITEWFNFARFEVLQIEMHLIEPSSNKIDEKVKDFLETFTWKTYDGEVLDDLFKMLEHLYKRIVKAHANIQSVRDKIGSWGNVPLYQRAIDQNTDFDGENEFCDEKENDLKITEEQNGDVENEIGNGQTANDFNEKSKNGILQIQNRAAIVEKRYKNCAETQDLIESVMFENYCLFRNKFVSIGSDGELSVDNDHRRLVELEISEADQGTYFPYEKYVDQMVGDQILSAIKTSLKYIYDEIRAPVPLVEICFSLDVEGRKAVFLPDLDVEAIEGFVAFMTSVMVDIFGMAKIFWVSAQGGDGDGDGNGNGDGDGNGDGRSEELESEYGSDFHGQSSASSSVGDHSKNPPEITRKSTDYTVLLKENASIEEFRLDILVQSKQIAKETLKAFEMYDKFAFIWTIDRSEYLAAFLKYGRRLSNEDFLKIRQGEFDEEPSFPSLVTIEDEIKRYRDVIPEIEQIPEFIDTAPWFRVKMHMFKTKLIEETLKWVNLFVNYLHDHVTTRLTDLETFILNAKIVLSSHCDKTEIDKFREMHNLMDEIDRRSLEVDQMFPPLKAKVMLLRKHDHEMDLKVKEQFIELPLQWRKLKKLKTAARTDIEPVKEHQMNLTSKRIKLYGMRIQDFQKCFRHQKFFEKNCANAYEIIDKMFDQIVNYERQAEMLDIFAELFHINVGPNRELMKQCRMETKVLKQVWDYWYSMQHRIHLWENTLWAEIEVEVVEGECKRIAKEVRALDTCCKAWHPYLEMEAQLMNLMTSLRVLTSIQNPSIKERHIDELRGIVGFHFEINEKTTFNDLVLLKLHLYEDAVKELVDKAVKEQAIEKALVEIVKTWSDVNFEFEEIGNKQLLKVSDDFMELLEDHLTQLQTMMDSKFVGYFHETVSEWLKKVFTVQQVIELWMEAQRKWIYLEVIFVGSEDINEQLPEHARKFVEIDEGFRKEVDILKTARTSVEACGKPDLIEYLNYLEPELADCERALNAYLETKRLAFPRFYFVSTADLLDILSNATNPERVGKHLTKLFDSLGKLLYKSGTKQAYAMLSKENAEEVPFLTECNCEGQVEVWLNRTTDAMRKTLHEKFESALKAYEEKPRHQWIFDWPAQPALCTTQIMWARDTDCAFAELEAGFENALRNYQKVQIQMLNALIELLMGVLTIGDRQKIMTVCTIDVHSRDVVAKLIAQKVRTHLSFQWQQQLRHRWDAHENDCFVNICDAEFRYWFEYLGNSPRLVVTPLTDRCYITLTQSLHLIMGGAPAGPAGTGKTETTKDLGKGLGMMVYVFNCSEQMDYKSCGKIFKGLSLTGAWGCFDEFNRISVEVLSVVAVQVKSILNAIKAKRETFNFMGEIINLLPSIGMFITMNPGYAGRTELPENVKSLFRPCAMVVPDFALICEIMLVAEGFQEARVLSRKFITLYTLCRELLSKQHHYDWGLRAIKSVLVVAGNLRRSDKDRPEVQVLMRALRDFNVPKIVTDDMSIFMDLIGDLFPALDVPRKRDFEFENRVKKAALDLKLQAEDNFILKVVQLEELFAVRHSVFIVGDAGTAKTCIWKTLNQTYKTLNRKPHYDVLNPKAITNDELFGVINRKTGEWIDGLFSFVMRNQCEMTEDGPKWIVLDGDIDPTWIESLNTLMDDNKVLTLANNERIALKPEMRLLFEISHLKTATPATVSRAGILFINAGDVGWMAYVNSWIETRSINNEKSILRRLFDHYVPPLMQFVAKKMKTIVPISPIAMINLICSLLECLLNPEQIPSKSPNAWYEMVFAFATIWGIGSSLFKDNAADYREEFSRFFRKEFQTVAFPLEDGKNVFSYYVDIETNQLKSWTYLMPDFHLNMEVPLQMVLVDNEETIRLKYFIEMLAQAKRGVMLVGSAGCGKSVIMNDKLKQLSDEYSVAQVPLNFYTSSEMMQTNLEKHLERRTGRTYRPIGSKAMIYFLDDMNMPEVDTYHTIQAHTIVRQFMDYESWYDRSDFVLKDIQKCQFVGAFNPTAGSFTIDPRLQRHFATFAVSEPSDDAIRSIYFSILSQYLTDPLNELSTNVVDQCANTVDATIRLHKRMSKMFLPTAQKFHYFFNMRDLTNIFQGLLWATKECCPDAKGLIRLWAHEATRVYCDKLITIEDSHQFENQLRETIDESFVSQNADAIMQKPLLMFHFAESLNDAKYMPIANWNSLNRILIAAMENYNEFIGDMNLTLFEDAMSHITRISRIMNSDRGYGLLIGVGGFGKQSLTRLAAFINSLELFQTTVRKGFNLQDFRTELAALYMKAGMKNINCCYLMTDAQVADEKFLVLINDFLATGHVSNLFTPEEVAEIASNMVNETKQAGLKDTPENCYNFFIEKVRRNLKVILCFSPVGSTLKTRTRKFPALLNCTSIDWLFDWPKEALKSVSKRFLANIDVLPPNLVDPIAEFMTYVHGTVTNISKVFNQNEKRFNYTTPKTFLELIALYDKLINEKTVEYENRIATLQMGLLKLADCAQQVDGLKVQLKDQEVVLAVKKKDADDKFAAVSAENEKIQGERDIVAENEKKVAIIEKGVSDKAKVCAADLKKAEPIMLKAIAALDTLDKKNLTELKAFTSPPEIVVEVCCAVSVLLTPKNKKVLPRNKRTWAECKKMMGTVDMFLQSLKNYDKKNIRPMVIDALMPYLKIPGFTGDSVKSKSMAAAGLCDWVINIYKFYEIYLEVGPKERALEAAEGELREAQTALQELNDKLLVFQKELDVLEGHLNDAVQMKEQCQAEADATAYKIDLAFRLVNGLASEKDRWLDSIEKYKEQITKLAGDVLQISCFLSYVGGFTSTYRFDLQHNFWATKLKSIEPAIPNSGGNPLEMICDDAIIAQWNNEGLPKDSMSVENAAILLNSSRWPLVIDPQLQGIKWIKKRYGSNLEITTFKTKNYLDVVEKSIRNGSTLLIADISEEIDSILDPLLGRILMKKGSIIVIGDKEIDYNPNFRLLLQTKLSNPHFKPEIQAQTTLINFSITADGLNQQLLAEVVKIERSDLEDRKANLTQQQNEFKIALKQLEEDLLYQLSNAGENVLDDESLVLNLERSKKASVKFELQIEEIRKTSIYIDEVRSKYKPVAERGVILYFILNNLNKVNPIYQFSLKSFVIVFLRAMMMTEAEENLTKRLSLLQESITHQVFIYTNRALFERDKLMFTSLVAIQCLAQVNKVSQRDLDLLLRLQPGEHIDSPVPFLSDSQWGNIVNLSKIETLQGLDTDIETAPKLWQALLSTAHPERKKLPGDWKYKSLIEQVCILRAMRPDRLISSMRCFIENNLGERFVQVRQTSFNQTFKETSSSIHTFFTLSPGVDPMREIEKLGQKLSVSFDANNLYSISLGQGQEVVAENALDIASQLGGWVVLQNIHLVAKWLPTLEKKIELITENPHEDFRLFLSAEPAVSAEYHVLPQGILESAVKITNEPPTGMNANIHSALDNFNQDVLEMCSKVTEFKALLFGLCYFHAAVVERRKFGPIGWNRTYPYNFGDLTICVDILNNYLEATNSTPWDDLRYLFGEIMYGGHITDDFDRRLCRTYLEVYLEPKLTDGELYFAPGFAAPPSLDYDDYHHYVDLNLPIESPELYGLHANTEVTILAAESQSLLETLLYLQPKRSESQSQEIQSRESVMLEIIDEILDKIPDRLLTYELLEHSEERSPFTIVLFQECERMNNLTNEMNRSLKELTLGVKGFLATSSDMEMLSEALYNGNVPHTWTTLAYPHSFKLSAWIANLILRARELESWASSGALPPSVWLTGFFNPQSFLTAIMQQTARKNLWPLDRMCLNFTVTKKKKDDFHIAPRDGVHLHGLFMEGARWSSKLKSIVDAIPNELFAEMPVIHVNAITVDKKDSKNMYECPVYKGTMRGPTFVWTFDLKTIEPQSKWILAGVCLLLQN